MSAPPTPPPEDDGAIVHWTERPREAAAFLCEALKFSVVARLGEHVWVGDGAGNRLHLAPVDAEHPRSTIELEVRTRDVVAESEDLLAVEGNWAAGELERAGDYRFERSVATPYGIWLRLYQEVEPPDPGPPQELPKRLTWDVDAEQSVRQLIQCVPPLFRDVTRLKVTEHAEAQAALTDDMRVTLSLALQAVFASTPSSRHPILRHVLMDLGLDPTPYARTRSGGP